MSKVMTLNGVANTVLQNNDNISYSQLLSYNGFKVYAVGDWIIAGMFGSTSLSTAVVSWSDTINLGTIPAEYRPIGRVIVCTQQHRQSWNARFARMSYVRNDTGTIGALEAVYDGASFIDITTNGVVTFQPSGEWGWTYQQGRPPNNLRGVAAYANPRMQTTLTPKYPFLNGTQQTDGAIVWTDTGTAVNTTETWSSGAVRAEKKGGVVAVHFNGSVTSIPYNGTGVVATLPEGWRPTRRVSANAFAWDRVDGSRSGQNSAVPVTVSIETSGNIQAYNTADRAVVSLYGNGIFNCTDDTSYYRDVILNGTSNHYLQTGNHIMYGAAAWITNGGTQFKNNMGFGAASGMSFNPGNVQLSATTIGTLNSKLKAALTSQSIMWKHARVVDPYINRGRTVWQATDYQNTGNVVSWDDYASYEYPGGQNVGLNIPAIVAINQN